MEEPKKGKGFLNKLKNAVSPGAAIGNLLGSFMPGIISHMMAMEKPIEEGGVLKPGEDKVGYLVIQVGGEMKISLVPLTYSKVENGFIVRRPIKTFTGEEAKQTISKSVE